MIKWRGCCHIQRDFYISTPGSFLKCSKGFWASGGLSSVFIQLPEKKKNPKMAPPSSLIPVVKAQRAYPEGWSKFEVDDCQHVFESRLSVLRWALSESDGLHRLTGVFQEQILDHCLICIICVCGGNFFPFSNHL